MKVVKVESDDPELRRLVGRVAAVITENGGRIAAGLVVRHLGHDLSMAAPSRQVPEGGPAVVLPAAAHVPIDGIAWAKSRSDLAYEALPPGLSAVQRELLDIFVEISNACRRVERVAELYPAVTLPQSPTLSEHVASIRPSWRAPAEVDPVRRLIVSRCLREFAAPGVPVESLIPLIDMCNHGPRGPIYRRDSNGWGVLPAARKGSSDELVLQYSAADTLGVALAMGYFEPGITWIESRPMSALVDGLGEVEVSNTLAPPGRQAPRMLQTEGGIEMSGVVLEVGGIARLATLLDMAVNLRWGSASEAARHGAAADLIESLVDSNRRAYTDLRAAVDDPHLDDIASIGRARALLRAVADHNLALLKRIGAEVAELADRGGLDGPTQ